MKIYSCTGLSYTDGLSNGQDTRFFRTKKEALSDARATSKGSANEEITVEVNVALGGLTGAVAMLNHEGWCVSSNTIAVFKNGRKISA